MGTHGRVGVAREAVACFLAQTAISRATLLVYNQHQTPIHFVHPRVRVVNEPIRYPALRYVRQRMHELARPDAAFIHWWDDDDLYLPWHLEDCLDHIRAADAWKPASSWFWPGDRQFVRTRNRFEGSWIFRSEFLRKAPLDTHPEYPDHPVVMQTIDAGQLAMTEFGDRTSYIYRWNTGAPHLSEFEPSTSGNSGDDITEQWRQQTQDTAGAASFTPATLAGRWRDYLAGTKDHISAKDYASNCARLVEVGWRVDELSATLGQS